MKITEKIEAIREKPEHIRIRYVWGCVMASMFVILIVWFFSIASMLKEKSGSSQGENSNIADIKQQLQEMQNQTEALKNISSDSLNASSEIINNNVSQNSANSQYPATSNTGNADDSESNIPQSNMYSGLSNTVSDQ
jgi:hypothetical protein